MLIFVERQYLPAGKEEERRYRMHKNGREYPDYLNFLNQAIGQSLPYLDRGMRELDYGCGSVPALSVLLEERGMQRENYDPFFPKLPGGPFDLIFSHRVF